MDRMLVFMLWKQISHDKQRDKADGDNDCWLELPSIIDDISASRNNCFSLFSGTHRRSTLCCIPWSSITDDQFSSILKEYITFCCISKHMLLDLEVEQLMICLEEDNFDIYDHLVHKALRLISMHHLSYKRNSLSWSLSGISLLMHCILVGETSSITRNRSPPTSYSLTLVPHSPAFMWNTLSPSLFSLFQQRGNHIEALESLSKLGRYDSYLTLTYMTYIFSFVSFDVYKTWLQPTMWEICFLCISYWCFVERRRSSSSLWITHVSNYFLLVGGIL